MRRRASEVWPSFEAFGDELIWRPVLEHALTVGVVGSVEASQ